MKVIDLLNKIANGEEVPKKIKYKNDIFTIREDKDDYVNGCDWFSDSYDYLELNDEVEIIEEDKKIKKINIYDKSIGIKGTTFYREKDIEIFQKLSMVINEIIDCLEEKQC